MTYDVDRLNRMIIESNFDCDIRNNDVIFVSSLVQMDMIVLSKQIAEYYMRRRVGFYLTTDQRNATVTLVDSTKLGDSFGAVKTMLKYSLFVDTYFDINDPELTKDHDKQEVIEHLIAYCLNQRLIDIRRLTVKCFKGLTTIDKDMYDNLRDLMYGADDESLSLAIGIIFNTDRSSLPTMEYIRSLLKDLNPDDVNLNNTQLREVLSFIENMNHYL